MNESFVDHCAILQVFYITNLSSEDEIGELIHEYATVPVDVEVRTRGMEAAAKVAIVQQIDDQTRHEVANQLRQHFEDSNVWYSNPKQVTKCVVSDPGWLALQCC